MIIFNINYLLLLLLACCQNIQNQIINPIITKYSTSIGINIAFSSYIFGFFAVGSLVSRPLSSKTLSKITSKSTIIYSSILMSICCVLYGFCGDNIILILILRFLHGSAFAFCTTALMSAVSFFIPQKDMGKGMSLFGLGQVLSVAIGPFISIYISENIGYSPLFYLSSALSMMACIICFFVEKIPVKTQDNTIFCKKISNIAFLALLLFAINSLDSAYILLYSQKLQIANVWIYFIVAAVSMLMARVFFGSIYDKKSLKFVLVPSFLLLAVSFILLILAQNLSALFFISAGFKGFAHAIAHSALQSESIKKVSEHERASASATFYIGCDLGMVIAPIYASFFAGDYIFLYITAVFVAVVSALLSIKIAR